MFFRISFTTVAIREGSERDVSQKTCHKVLPKPDVREKTSIVAVRYFILYIFHLFLPGHAVAQSETDTLPSTYMSGEVEIIAHSNDNNALSETSLDFSLSNELLASDLATYLDRKGLAQINVNGAPGAAASIRFRGSSSDHTAFLWKGFAINSPALGTTDLSLIPLFLFDRAALNSNPSSAAIPGSNLGASVDLISASPLSTNHVGRAFFSWNNLGNSFSGFDVPFVYKSKRNYNWTLRTRAFHNEFQNNFQYRDVYRIGAPVVSQTHNNSSTFGMLTDAGFITGSHAFELSTWYQKKNMLLPSVMGKASSGTAEQYDQFLRAVATHKWFGYKKRIESAVSFGDEQLLFRDNKAGDGYWSINSLLRSQTWQARVDASFEWRKFKFRWNALNGFYSVKNASYVDGIRQLNTIQSGVSVVFVPNKRQELQFDSRLENRIRTGKPFLSLGYRVFSNIENQPAILEVVISRKFRFPDFNELYWFPGGNENLRAEQGLFAGLYSGRTFNFRGLEMMFKPGITCSEITNWIQWVPQSGGIWSPRNYKTVRIATAEIPVWLNCRIGKTKISGECRYTFTSARGVNDDEWSTSERFDMIYTPAHLFFCSLSATRNETSLGFRNRYSSSRFTEESNSWMYSLDAYHLTSVFLAQKMKVSRNEFNVLFSIDNLFNTSYESVRAYAMPGRVYQISINYQLNNKTTK